MRKMKTVENNGCAVNKYDAKYNPRHGEWTTDKEAQLASTLGRSVDVIDPGQSAAEQGRRAKRPILIDIKAAAVARSCWDWQRPMKKMRQLQNMSGFRFLLSICRLC